MKRIKFSATPTIHVLYKWSYAYRAARTSDWETYARDRERFNFRIQQATKLLNYILEQSHRTKIFNERFYIESECNPTTQI